MKPSLRAWTARASNSSGGTGWGWAYYLIYGVAILTAYFGKELVARFEPYQAVLLHGKWAVMGDSPMHKEARREQERLGPDHFIAVRGGGAPEITLSPTDARVEHIALAR